jgi:hypothetical protein
MPKIAAVAKDGKVLLRLANWQVEVEPDDVARLCSDIIAAGAAAGMGMDYPLTPITFN